MLENGSRYEMAERIAVICPHGIGNLVMTLPALRGLKRSFPYAEIHFIAINRSTKALLKDVPQFESLFDKLWTIPWPQGLRDLRAALTSLLNLRRLEFDYSIVTFPNYTSHYNVLNFLVKARTRVAPKFPDSGLLHAHWLNHWALEIKTGRHDVRQNIELFSSIPGYSPDLALHGDSGFPLSYRKKAIVGIHPGGSRGQEYKRWNPESFASVAEKVLAEHPTWTVRTFIGPDERSLRNSFARIESVYPDRFQIYAGEPVDRLVDKVSECAVFVSNDSGLMHMAALTGCPGIVGLFGPTDPLRNAPYGQSCVIAQAGLSCSPCTKTFARSSRTHRCTNSRPYECFDEISIDWVCQTVHKRIRELEVTAQVNT